MNSHASIPPEHGKLAILRNGEVVGPMHRKTCRWYCDLRGEWDELVIFYCEKEALAREVNPYVVIRIWADNGAGGVNEKRRRVEFDVTGVLPTQTPTP